MVRSATTRATNLLSAWILSPAPTPEASLGSSLHSCLGNQQDKILPSPPSPPRPHQVTAEKKMKSSSQIGGKLASGHPSPSAEKLIPMVMVQQHRDGWGKKNPPPGR